MFTQKTALLEAQDIFMLKGTDRRKTRSRRGKKEELKLLVMLFSFLRLANILFLYTNMSICGITTIQSAMGRIECVYDEFVKTARSGKIVILCLSK